MSASILVLRRVALGLTLALSSLPALGADESATVPDHEQGPERWDDEGWAEEDEGPVLESRVESARPRRASKGDARPLDERALATATPEEALASLAGVHLVHDGGPLAPVRVRQRGLEGPRLGSALLGLRLDDPATGAFDPAALPWGVLSSVSVAGASPDGRPGLHFDISRDDEVKARIGVGTLETLRLDAAATHAGDAERLSVGASVATTKGDFLYRPTTASGGQRELVTRQNNDQRRASGLFHGRTWLPFGSLSGLAWGSSHEGGVPGFATAPTAGLRARRLTGGARAALSGELGRLSGELDASLSGSSRSTWDELRPEEDTLASLTGSVGALLSVDDLLPDLSLRLSGRSERAAVLGSGFFRDVHQGAAAAELLLFERWLLADANVGLATYSDLGLLPRVDAGVQVGTTSWGVGARVSHGGRAPTLDELYAPQGLVLGNPSLRFERSTDGEVYALLSSPAVEGRVAAFVGRMEDTILFVNRNAFDVQPINTGPLWRAGLEGRVQVEPHPWLGLEVTASALASRLDATGAPLPVVPPLSSRIAARLGPLEGATLSVVAHQRAAVTNTLYGTLPTPGHLLVDVISRMPLGDALVLSAALTNVLDVLDARDANLLPLPGRQLFVSLEVRT